MRIRHCILMGVLGAAIFLPTYAFAEKNEGAGQTENARITEVHTNTVGKAEKIGSPVKAAPAAPELKRKEQKEEVPKPVESTDRKAVPAEKTVPDPPGKNRQSDKSAHPQTHGKNIHASTPSGDVEEKRRADKEKQPAGLLKKKRSEVSESTEKRITDPIKSKREKEIVSQKQQVKPNVILNEEQNSHSLKEELQVKRKPVNEAGKNAPFEKREIPGEVEGMNSAPQRLPSSGGPSQETFSHGTGMVSFIHYPDDWEIGLKLRTIYHSREDIYCYQWMNAPPSPPPKAAPFIY
ncbi:hypothetical protein [Bacillus sp. Marseille-Q1617]|uniref:hypothetical protein n=1 Tax=Bacillus sp. Marseille-Q1617 TaxID=2736887 RepID=UPI00158B388D|nr:hypothetical protein [Bacillus sp. Marseille-Q1617]